MTGYNVNQRALLQHCPTVKDALTHLAHKTLERKYSHIRTVSDAYDTNYMLLSDLTVYSPDAPSMLIEAWLIQLSLFFDLPLNKDQVKELAWLIYDDCNYLNIAEVTLLFTRIKKGHYGALYGKIDPAEILRWCREYRKERGSYVSKLPDDYVSPILEQAKKDYMENNFDSL